MLFLVPWPAIKLVPPALGTVLATGPPGKSFKSPLLLPQTLSSECLRAGRRMRGSWEEFHFIFPTLWLENWHHFVICKDLSVVKKKKKKNPPICIFCLLQRRANDICVRKSFLTCKLWENKWEKIAALSLVEDFFNDAKRFQKFPGLNPTLAPSCLLHLSTHSTMYTEGLLCARPCTRCWQ